MIQQQPSLELFLSVFMSFGLFGAPGGLSIFVFFSDIGFVPPVMGVAGVKGASGCLVLNLQSSSLFEFFSVDIGSGF